MESRRNVRNRVAPAFPRKVGRRRNLTRLTALSVMIGLAGAATIVGVSSSSHLSSVKATPVTDLVSRPVFSQIVYQVADYTGNPAKTTWEVLTDNRPFSETDLSYDQDPLLGASPQAGTVTTSDSVYSLKNGHLVKVSAVAPSVPTGDQALAVEVTDLIGRGLAQALGQTLVVAGRACNLVRFAEPPNGPITPLGATDHDDLCLDENGLILSESWTYQAKLVLQRTAIEVSLNSPDPEIRPAPSPDSASAGEATPGVEVKLGTNPESAFLASPPTPGGYQARPPVAVTVVNPAKPSQTLDSSTVWSFVAGGQLITVEAGNGALPWQTADTPTLPVSLQGLGQASSALESTGPEIRVQLSGGRWVRVDGSVPLIVLSAYANQLTLGS